MSSPYVGEIRIFAGNFAPAGWMLCNGALLPISDYDTLFNLIGTTYGGDGEETFALPNLQSRVPVHQGSGFVLGQLGGAETVTLSIPQIPSHSHLAQANSNLGTQSVPSAGFWAQSTLDQFSSAAPSVAMAPSALGNSGGSQPHDNMLPFLTLNYIISLFGIYPSQT
jgi:microcystin-dependent protein